MHIHVRSTAIVRMCALDNSQAGISQERCGLEVFLQLNSCLVDHSLGSKPITV